MLTLLLTRHGLVEPDDVMLGAHLDLPLSEAGREQARALAHRLEGLDLDRIVSSPMNRALETARIVADGRPVETDERLRELDYGAWEGLTYAAIEARDPVLREAWEADPATTRPPGGETAAECAERCRSFLAEVIASAEGHRASGPDGEVAPLRVLVAAHGSLDRILLAVALDIPVRDYRRRLTQDRANLTVLHWGPGADVGHARAILLNDVAHLRRPGEPPWEPTLHGIVEADVHRGWQDPSGRG